MNKIYEIGQQFRNESISSRHNPEFSSVEWYMTYANYNDMLKMCEDLLSEIVFNLFNSYEFKYKMLGQSEEIILNFNRPFKIIDIVSELQIKMNIKFPDNLSSDEAKEFLINI